MQFGTLSAPNQALFLNYILASIREPSFALWIESFGDVSKYIKGINTDRNIESLRGFSDLAIGTATIEATNEDGYFYDDGKSKIPDYSRVKIWAGFHGLNIPIYTGIIYSVVPLENGTVSISCRGMMGLLADSVFRDTDDNRSAYGILTKICSTYHISSNVLSNTETARDYYNPLFVGLRVKTVLQNICDSLFSIIYFDEDGEMCLHEREYSNHVDYTIKDNIIKSIYRLADSEIINEAVIEYIPGNSSISKDQQSIDLRRLKSRNLNVPSFTSGVVSSFFVGTGAEEIIENLEGFKFTSDANANYIDSITIKLKSDDAVGYVSAKIYSDNAGFPDTLLQTSIIKPAGEIPEDFTYIQFRLYPSLLISGSTAYWCIVDVSALSSGSIYFQVNTNSPTNVYVYNDGSWNTEINKYPSHIIKGSGYAKVVGDDIIRFYKEPKERIRIITPAIHHLQLFDSIFVDSEKVTIKGRFVIEGIRTIISSGATTIYTLRRQ